MNAKALICDEKQNFSIEDVVLKDHALDQIVIRTLYTGVSIGTEFALIRNKLSWGAYPMCTGYMGTGIVEAIGSDIDNFVVGDEVYFRCNDSMSLADGASVSCVSGVHCSHIVIRPNTTHGADHMAPGAALDVACMFVMPAVGLYGVDTANPRIDQTVVVHGSGLIGLGVVAACRHRGCVVIAVDVNERQLAIAREMGRRLHDQRYFTRCGSGSEEDRSGRRRCRLRMHGAPAVHRSGHRTMPQVRQFRLAGKLRQGPGIHALSSSA